MRLMVTGGGTGGHLYPAMAVITALRRNQEVEVLYVGTRKGLESRVVPREGIDLKTIWISGLHRGRVFSNLLFPLKMGVSLTQCIALIHQFRPCVIFGTGGYVSWPVLTAGWLKGIPLVIQEQNRAPGLVTRLMAPHARSIHLSYESSLRYFKDPGRCHVSGNPTREELGKPGKNGISRFKSGDKVIFIFGGSQGSRVLNDCIEEGLPELMNDPKIHLIWAAGPRWVDGLKPVVEPYKKRIELFGYIHDMGRAYADSDLVVCRAGATTAAEITRLGIPSIMVPFEAAAGGHQRENARALAEKGAGDWVSEEEAGEGLLIPRISKWINDTRGLKGMAEAARRMGRPEAADRIASDILHAAGLAGEKKPRKEGGTA